MPNASLSEAPKPSISAMPQGHSNTSSVSIQTATNSSAVSVDACSRSSGQKRLDGLIFKGTDTSETQGVAWSQSRLTVHVNEEIQLNLGFGRQITFSHTADGLHVEGLGLQHGPSPLNLGYNVLLSNPSDGISLRGVTPTSSGSKDSYWHIWTLRSGENVKLMSSRDLNKNPEKKGDVELTYGRYSSAQQTATDRHKTKAVHWKIALQRAQPQHDMRDSPALCDNSLRSYTN